jgi:flagellar M-ring protein FliF
MAEAVVDNAPAKTGPAAAKRPLPGLSFLENIA